MVGHERREWINEKFVGNFLGRLGMSEQIQLPLEVSEFTPELIADVLRHINSNSNAGTVVMPLSTLFNLLPQYCNTELWQ
jgi:hypothetical protein